jgi:hypothetical protein
VPPAHPLRQQDPPHLTTPHPDPLGLGGLDQTVEGPLRGCLRIRGVQVPTGGPCGAARRLGAGQRDDPTPLGFGDAALTPAAGPVPQPVQALGVKPCQPFPHRLHVTAQPCGDGTGPVTVPTRRDHPRPHDPVRWGMPRPRQRTDLPLLLRIGGRTRVQQPWHDRSPPPTSIPLAQAIYTTKEERRIRQHEAPMQVPDSGDARRHLSTLARLDLLAAPLHLDRRELAWRAVCSLAVLRDDRMATTAVPALSTEIPIPMPAMRLAVSGGFMARILHSRCTVQRIRAYRCCLRSGHDRGAAP